MSYIEMYLWFFIGILLSLFVPVAAKWIHEFRESTSKGGGDTIAKVWNFTKPLLKVGVASALIGFLILAIILASGAKITSWYVALLAGYSWDSTLQKFSITS